MGFCADQAADSLPRRCKRCDTWCPARVWGDLLLPADGKPAVVGLERALGACAKTMEFYLQEVAAQLLLSELSPLARARIQELDQWCDLVLQSAFRVTGAAQ